MTTEKKDTAVLTPLGFISFPYLAKPDTGRPNSSGKYTAQLFIKKDEFRIAGGLGQLLVQKIIEVGRTKFGPDANLNSFKHTLYDVDALPPEKRAKLPESVRTGFIQINCASGRAPIVKDAAQRIMTMDEVLRISGGDICRFVVAPYTYNQKSGGVALGLNVVQFKEKGPVAFGGGGAGVELLTDLEQTVQTPTEVAAQTFAQPVPAQQVAAQPVAAQPVQAAPVATQVAPQPATSGAQAPNMFGALGL